MLPQLTKTVLRILVAAAAEGEVVDEAVLVADSEVVGEDVVGARVDAGVFSSLEAWAGRVPAQEDNHGSHLAS